MGSEVVTKGGFRLYYHPAPKKRYKETVVFVHHMWGSHKTTRRHYQYLNEKGFDCVSFNLLLGSSHEKTYFHPLYKKLYKGVFYLWTKQIHAILNEVKGDKIIFAFSGPSLSSLWASYDRQDIKKIICDGGPFHQIYDNSKNFFRKEMGIQQKSLNSLVAFAGTTAWGLKPLQKLNDILTYWPNTIPILSIRGKEDDIVDIDSIREVFNPHSHLDLEIMELPHGKHIDGIKNFPDQYKKTLFPFIKKNLTPIEKISDENLMS